MDTGQTQYWNNGDPDIFKIIILFDEYDIIIDGKFHVQYSLMNNMTFVPHIIYYCFFYSF